MYKYKQKTAARYQRWHSTKD